MSSFVKMQDCKKKVEESAQVTWLLEELIGVGSKVIPLGLDEVRRQFLAPFQKNIRFHVGRRFCSRPNNLWYYIEY